MNYLGFCLLTVFLAASVNAQGAPDDDSCGCTSNSITIGVGEIQLGRGGHWSCNNTEEIEMVDSCVGSDGSLVSFAFVPGKRPDITRVCENENGCKFDVERKDVAFTCASRGGAPQTKTKSLPIPVGCKCGKCFKKPDCGCTATTKTYAAGEYKFGKSFNDDLSETCSNVEEMKDVVVRCEGENGDFSQVNIVPDQYPNITRSCDEEVGVGCGFEKERRATLVTCTNSAGQTKEQTKQLPLPVGCKCCGCKKGGRPGGSGGYGGRPSGGSRPSGGRPDGGSGGRPDGASEGQSGGRGGRGGGRGGRGGSRGGRGGRQRYY